MCLARWFLNQRSTADLASRSTARKEEEEKIEKKQGCKLSPYTLHWQNKAICIASAFKNRLEKKREGRISTNDHRMHATSRWRE